MNTATILPSPTDNKVTKSNGTVVVRNIASKPTKRRGITYGPRVEAGQHAVIVPREKIVLWGVDRNKVSGLRPYRIEFKIGDSAEYDSFNFAYVGTIVAIGEKTVTIQDHGKNHVLDLYTFNWRNHGFDIEA